MAIINTSPDSFSGDGLHPDDTDTIVKKLRLALDQGADILDIGGQSTRPGAEIIDAEQEIQRVVPVIKLARNLTDKPISVDTFKPEVANAALAAGATIINDIHAAEDPGMVAVAKTFACRIVIMHSRGTPKTMGRLTGYPKGVVKEVCAYLAERANALQTAGIAPKNIILDPGIGFAKTAAQSFELTGHLDEVVSLGYPVLYGASQKSFLGKALGTVNNPAPLADRHTATTVAESYAMLHGAAIIRTHDVKAAAQTRAITESLRQAR